MIETICYFYKQRQREKQVGLETEKGQKREKRVEKNCKIKLCKIA